MLSTSTEFTPPFRHRDSGKALVSMSYWSVIESVLRDSGLRCTWLDNHPGLTLSRQTGRLRCEDYESLLTQSLAALGPTLGYEVGLRGYPTKHGALGLALMSCPTLGDALRVGLRYQISRMPYYDMHQREQGEWILIEIHERLATGPLRGFGMEAAAIEIVTLLQSLASVPAHWLHLYFDTPPPPYFDTYRDRLPQCTFHWTATQVAIHQEALHTRLPSANAEALRLACLECDADMMRLGYVGSVRERVAAMLNNPAQAPRTIEHMAQTLSLSERSLKRHLQHEGCTFKQLQDEARARTAKALLSDPQQAISDIAQLVGFEDPAHFTRAFKRWTGHTPSAIRMMLNNPLV